MTRILLQSSRFVRAARRLLKKSPEQATAFTDALKQLSFDAFHPSLKSHKLRGELKGFWSCSAGYDLRIVFEFVMHDGHEAILLVSAGTHDDVY